MRYEDYKQKYNKFTMDLVHIETMPYLKLLGHLHCYLFGDCIIRCEENSKRRINNLIHKVMTSDFSNKILYDILEELCKCISAIWLYQPFYDGNTRTVVLF